jgi:hypothetical protein
MYAYPILPLVRVDKLTVYNLKNLSLLVGTNSEYLIQILF